MKPRRRPQRYAAPPHQQYQRALVRLVKQWRVWVKEYILPHLAPALEHAEQVLRTDAPVGDIISRISILKLETKRSIDREVPPLAEQQAKKTAGRGKEQTNAQAKTVIGIEPLAHEPWLNDFVDIFTQANTGLISSVSEDTFNAMTQLVRTAALEGSSAGDLADDIMDRLDVAESRARMIARDQIAKFNGELTRVRQGRLGVARYIWRTSLDERVRESHASLEGKEFRWDDPPAVGHPGQDYNCRCTAEPVFEEED